MPDLLFPFFIVLFYCNRIIQLPYSILLFLFSESTYDHRVYAHDQESLCHVDAFMLVTESYRHFEIKDDFKDFFVTPSKIIRPIDLIFCQGLNLFICSQAYSLAWGRGARRVIGISGSLIWSKTLMELIFNLCGEFR